MTLQQVQLRQDWIAAFCRRWRIAEFALFGSVLTSAFKPDSDVDVPVTFPADAEWSLADWVTMQEELEQSFGRPADMVESGALRNPVRRHHILNSKQVHLCGLRSHRP